MFNRLYKEEETARKNLPKWLTRKWRRCPKTGIQFEVLKNIGYL